jgi:hypothetical protein
VNIAAGFEALAIPGSMLISETVQSNVTNKSNIQTEYVNVSDG